MITAPVALAFTAGMIAAFNPCGFSLLPAYIGAFVAGDRVTERADRRVLRAVGVAAAVSVGFVVVFATVGLVIDSVASSVREELPWVTIVVGSLLVVAGIAAIAGWKPRLAVSGPRFSLGSNNLAVMVAYGITYAVASISCTIGPFLAVTGTAMNGSVLEGLASYVSYALGMGAIILVIGVTAALAHSAVATGMRRASRFAPRLGGVVMVLAGGYAIWYGRWELGVYGGDLGTDPVIDTMEDVRLSFVQTLDRIGTGRLAAVAVIALVATVVVARSGALRARAIASSVSTGVDASAIDPEASLADERQTTASTAELESR